MVSTAKSFPSVFGEKANISGNSIIVNASTFRIKPKGFAAAWARFFRSCARERDLVTSETFHQALENETRRSERSGKSFALLLLSGIERMDAKDGASVRTLQSSVCSVLRDIDLVGWYEDGATIGIICREIGADNVTASRAIVTRIHKVLAKNLEAAQVYGLSITWHLFSCAARDPKGKKTEVVRCEVGMPTIEPKEQRLRDLRSAESSHFGASRQELS